MENRILNVLLTEIFGPERERGTYYIGGEEVGGLSEEQGWTGVLFL